MTLCNNFRISHLRIVTYSTLISIDFPVSESVLLPDNCYSVSGWAAVNTLLYFLNGRNFYILYCSRRIRIPTLTLKKSLCFQKALRFIKTYVCRKLGGGGWNFESVYIRKFTSGQFMEVTYKCKEIKDRNVERTE